MTIRIHSILIDPAGSAGRPKDRYNRVPQESVIFVAGHGIQGDRKAGKHPDRQINVTFMDTLNALRDKGFMTEPGMMGEQLVIDGLSESQLEPGQIMQIGESVRVEIVKKRTGCERFSVIQGRTVSEAADQMGVYVRVLQGGEVKVGDAVQVQEMALSSEE